MRERNVLRISAGTSRAHRGPNLGIFQRLGHGVSSAASAETVTVRQSLDLLDDRFSPLAEGVAQAQYALWLGSGISLERVTGLDQVVARVVEFLRAQVETGNPHCRFRDALNSALELAGVSEEERSRIDLAQKFDDWAESTTIVQRLTGQYARLLDLAVRDEPDDYLLWNGVDVVSTFASESTEPDIEHLCIGILILEGLAPEIASANWDGLLEKAVEGLTGGQPTIAVVVRPDDLRDPPLRSRLFKFHGCAVKAAEDEAAYRSFLVARQSQIHRWRDNPTNQAVVGQLISIVATKPTLMVGLSAQDANIQSVFAAAEAQMPWPWPSNRPSCVFADDTIGPDQRTLLRNVYREAYGTHSRAIDASALFRAYAKPFFVSLVLHMLCSKLRKLVQLVPGQLGASGRLEVCDGLVVIRDNLAEIAERDRSLFVERLVEYSSGAMTMFRDGSTGTPQRRYYPVSQTPIQQMDGDLSLLESGLGEAAVAAGVLGMGMADGSWSVELVEPRGTVRVDSEAGTATVYFVANSHAALRLWHVGTHVQGKDTVIVHARERPISQPRSPRGVLGRTGSPKPREVSVHELMADVTTSGALMQRFREEVAL